MNFPKFTNSATRPGLIALIFLLGLNIKADTIKVSNGELLQGTIIEETETYVTFRSLSFGEIKIKRDLGVVIERTTNTINATKPNTASLTAQTNPTVKPQNNTPSPGLLQNTLGLSERWSAEVETNLMQQKDRFNNRLLGLEFNLSYKIPNEEKSAQPLHEFSLFSSYNFQKVDAMTVGQSMESVARYFYQPISSWLLVSQLDWNRDRLNNIEARSNIISIPAYRFTDTDTTRLLAGVGASYHYDSHLIPNQYGNKIKQLDGLRVAFYQLFRHKLSQQLSLQQTLVLLASPSHPSTTYNLRFQTTLKRMITQHLSLNFSEEYTRDENTEIPIESISILKVMLGYSF